MTPKPARTALSKAIDCLLVLGLFGLQAFIMTGGVHRMFQ